MILTRTLYITAAIGKPRASGDDPSWMAGSKPERW